MPDWLTVVRRAPRDQPSLMQWAWEFLRRNTEYRKGWRQSVEPWLLERQRPPHGRGGLTGATFNSAGHEKAVAAGVAEPWGRFARRFGIEFPLDPRSRTYLGFLRHGVSYIQKDTWDPQPALVDLAPTELAILFDIDEPLEPQLIRARAILEAAATMAALERALQTLSEKERQGKAGAELRRLASMTGPGASAALTRKRGAGTRWLKRPRPQVAKFPIYLRLLDGHDAGATRAELGQALFPKNADPAKNVDNQLRAAEELCRYGYRALVLYDEPNFSRKTRR